MMNAAYDVLGFGEASIDEVWRLPPGFALGDKSRATARERIGGGQIATALVAAARLGARAGFLGPIGDDALGEEIARGLAEDRVDLLSGAKATGAGSRSALLLVGADGERSVLDIGDRQDFAETSALAHLSRTRALHLDATRPRAALALARAALEAGVLISIDVDHLPADAEAAAQARALVALATLCVLPRGLPSLLTGEPDAARALAALRRTLPRASLVVETRGAAGALALGEDGLVDQPARVVDVVDTTACGDTFRGALLVARLEGMSDAVALRFATHAAALKCRDLGRRGCPTRAELDAALRYTDLTLS
jgi:sulfofructose kinase